MSRAIDSQRSRALSRRVAITVGNNVQKMMDPDSAIVAPMAPFVNRRNAREAEPNAVVPLVGDVAAIHAKASIGCGLDRSRVVA